MRSGAPFGGPRIRFSRTLPGATEWAQFHLPLSSLVPGSYRLKIALMRLGNPCETSRLGHGTRAIALAIVLGLSVSACDQHSTAQQGAAAAHGVEVPKVASAAASRPVNDTTLAVNVKAALMASAALNATTIEVSAKEGIVTLSGTTNTNTRRDLAGFLALKVDGVVAVRNRITVISSS